MDTIGPETIDKLARIGRELAQVGREDDAAAIDEAVAALSRPGRGWLTTGQAAERLNVARQTIKNWVQRGTLRGVNIGTRWLISEESVETIEGVRRAVADMDAEGYPTADEIRDLTKRTRRAARQREDVA